MMYRRVEKRINAGLKRNSEKILGLDWITASVGVVRHKPEDKSGEPVNAETLYHRADIAMFNAKSEAGTHLKEWQPGMTMSSGVPVEE